MVLQICLCLKHRSILAHGHTFRRLAGPALAPETETMSIADAVKLSYETFTHGMLAQGTCGQSAVLFADPLTDLSPS